MWSGSTLRAQQRRANGPPGEPNIGDPWEERGSGTPPGTPDQRRGQSRPGFPMRREARDLVFLFLFLSYQAMKADLPCRHIDTHVTRYSVPNPFLVYNRSLLNVWGESEYVYLKNSFIFSFPSP